ncbi:uncharacterized protein LOC119081688 [Bradysia coprophila]|uniref:uncharacterized protein LOC119081688 n=1 Tax=Bradysia coprophila TaxID=38358 RepID=UPI00187D96E3|nr:uncharacterized protein LOC119081688 [Bradysia coprophila]
MKKILAVLILTNIIVLAYTASIFDYLTEDPQSRDSETKKNCLCNGPSCICCLDFNMSFIDLGGPGCVRMNYISAEEGIAINVSYGSSLLHSQTVKGPDPAPTCLNIFTQLAQMCARFSELLPTDDGLRGCINLEPMLLGEAQLELPVGCFKMGPNGMEVIESSVQVINEQQPKDPNAQPIESADDDEEEEDTTETNAGNDTIAGYNTADILAAVNASAEEGIALISNWLGLTGNKSQNETVTDQVPPNNQQQ